MSRQALVNCSFCGQNNDEVAHMISGPSVFICSDCIDLCGEIVADAKRKQEERKK